MRPNKATVLTTVLVLALFICAQAMAQEVYRSCGMEGDARARTVREMNRLKNRYQPPQTADYDISVTFAAMVAPGDDENRWSETKAAEITGYVHDVKVGGVESANCHARDPLYRDTHIELVLDPMNAGGPKRLIVEVTPRWRSMIQQKGIDWTTNALRRNFLGRWVKVHGWLFFDAEHKNESENTNPGRARNWRATAWEIHPVVSIEVVQKPRR